MDGNGVKNNPKERLNIFKWVAPISVINFREFLTLYTRFSEGFAEFFASLYRLNRASLQSGGSSKWGDRNYKDFDGFKTPVIRRSFQVYPIKNVL